ncbi:D-alanyl-D-alanine carboxypeptidase/D-alanyl-D-alanine endopeptidase [Larkinella rosea]|uniref:D-alanyl-D-alanine carboxypeptidase/D-alanyl-D-alanine-endopeptidase n=1 Tax=Larkinella rosea TaxID=2025312 RepID=A0A3P1C2L8_9BACT|nr:D-alanyl-D-alanine carboxypeptidase/D-alanyl-D-alanine-endopeptidase [Larkinella rosea]RRB07346.1 D-alanyl-D-alanine carboxypeptidase/D-alanyl-D-alanine-endopeptidase [Larkinella rosea]
MYRYPALTLSYFFVIISLCQAHPSADSLALKRLQTTINQLQTSPFLRNGTAALSVRRTRDGVTLLDYNAQLSLPSASTLKLVTTATTLAVLGDNYTFRTILEHDGTLKDSILNGNLYIRGSGDPSLGSNRFAEFADAPTLLRTWTEMVKAAGIKHIRGSVIGDASVIQSLPVPDTWVWGDMGNYYGAGISGLNFNENLYRAVFKPAKTVGLPAGVLRTEPSTPFLRLQNNVKTGPAGSGDEVIIYNAPFSPLVFLEGTVPLGVNEFGVKGSLPDPAYFTAFALNEQLVKTGISISGLPQSIGPGRKSESMTPDALPIIPPAKRTQLHLHTSVPLSELARLTNHQSINLYAEVMLILAGNSLTKAPVGTEKAILEMTRFWQNKGVDMSGFRPKDGCGLSPVGALTAANLTGILAAMSKEKSFLPFYDSIPVVGESGTVKSLARGTAAVGNVRAKSGTIEGVRAYAGYATSADCELVSFTVLVNKYQPGSLKGVMTLLEQIMAQLTALKVND